MRPALSTDKFRESYLAENGDAVRGSPTHVSPRRVPDGPVTFPSAQRQGAQVRLAAWLLISKASVLASAYPVRWLVSAGPWDAQIAG